MRSGNSAGRAQRPRVPVRIVFPVAWVISLAVSAPPDALPSGASLAAQTPPIVYVERRLESPPVAEERVFAVERALEGRLIVRDGEDERVLVDARSDGATVDTPLDVADPAVSWDGSRIVFAGYSGPEAAWRIYEVWADGSGLRRVTMSDRRIDLSVYGEAAPFFEGYDDIDPCYLPDGRVCFVSTRYPGLAPGGRLRATNLYVVQREGSGLRRITTERFGADTPAVDPVSGRIVYSRWWLTASGAPPPSGGISPDRPPPYYGPVTNVNNFSPLVIRGIDTSAFPGVNNWSLAAIHPDGSGLAMFAGFGLNRELTMAYRPAFLPGGDVLALFIRQSPFLGYPGAHGLRVLRPGPSLPEALGGPQTFRGSALIRDPRTAAVIGSPFRSPGFYYSSVEALPDGRLLVTGYPGGQRREPEGWMNHDVYLQSGSEQPVPLFGAPDRVELDAVPLVMRPRPPVIEDAAPPLKLAEAPYDVETAVEAGGTFTFLAENIHFNAPVDVPVANAPPVGRGLTIEFYMNPQRAGVEEPEPPVLIGSREIGPDGRVEMELPAGVPLFEVLRRRDGRIALGRDGQPFHVGGMNFGVADQTVRCVGCHAGHSLMEVPDDPAWTNVAPSARVVSSSSLSVRPGRLFVTLNPAILVDRRRDEISSEWAPALDDGLPEVRMRWTTPITAREVVVYAARTVTDESLFGTRDQRVGAFSLSTYLGDEFREEIRVRAAIEADGTPVALDETKAFDVLTVTILPEDVTGSFLEVQVPALSEVEVIGKVVPDAAGTYALIRGDADCDNLINITDSLVTLNSLFRGTGPLCCDAAADTNGDGRLNITDPIVLLNYSFFGGPEPAPPYPDCGRAPVISLECEQESCP